MILVETTKKNFIYYDSSSNIAIKILRSNTPSLKDLKKLDNEFHVGKTISHPAFRSSIKRCVMYGKQALYLEWPDTNNNNNNNYLKT